MSSDRVATTFCGMVGQSPVMNAVFEKIVRFAPLDRPVLIRGESGTGKEMVARALHSVSRRSGPYVPVSCGGLSADRLESDLFGHIRGAFTGAIETRPGLFMAARGGTLLLDMIDLLHRPLQVKLLRVLQQSAIRPIGSDYEYRVDCRVVATTSRALEDDLGTDGFREDLYYRLDVYPIDLPPLRDRPEDIVPLANFFLTRATRDLGRDLDGIGDDAIDWLLRYDYPGNVRELENLIARAVIIETGPRLSANHLVASRTASIIRALRARGS